MTDIKKTIKFHGLEVANVIVRYSQREVNKPDVIKIHEFDATKDPQYNHSQRTDSSLCCGTYLG
jgi:hypothetical protein